MSEQRFQSTSGGPSPEEVLAHPFPSARRGLDPDAVRAYLAELAGLLRRARGREAELTERLAAAERSSAPAPLDAAALTAAVGHETARVLQAANEAADEVIARANTQSEALRATASTLFEEEQRRAAAAAAVVTAAAERQADRLLEGAREECREMVEEARAARQRILADLAARRRELHVQLEQLRAGKDALSEVVDAVASYVVHSVDELKEQLAGAEERARLAAEGAGVAAGAGGPAMSEQGLVAEADALAGATGEETPPELDAPPEVASDPQVAAGEAPPPEGNEANAIDELFAKIRQSRSEQVERARSILGAAPSEEVPPSEGVPSSEEANPAGEGLAAAHPPTSGEEAREALSAAPLAEGASAPHLEASERPGAEQEAAGTVAAEAVLPAEGAPSGEEVEEQAPPPEREAIDLRDELLAPSTNELARVLKRQLRLEQNQLLDAFRHLKGGDPLSLLPGREMAARLEHDVSDALTAAFAAGASFAARSATTESEPLLPPVEAIGAISAALGMAVVGPIRHRVEQGLSEGDEEPATAIGAAFREWKGAGAEQAASDFSVRAFCAGVIDVARAAGSALSWIVDDGEQRCPDCDDNAIAGAQRAGERFPTGHEQPPIHPGCRCLLALSPG